MPLIDAVGEVGKVYSGVIECQSVLDVFVAPVQKVIDFVGLERINFAVKMLLYDFTSFQIGYPYLGSATWCTYLVTSESFVAADLSAAPALAHG